MRTLIIWLLVVMAACDVGSFERRDDAGHDDAGGDAAPAPKQISEFAFFAGDNPDLHVNVTTVISGDTIAATLPTGTSPNGLVARFASIGVVTVNGIVQESALTPNDFSSPVPYHVTAADGSSRDYTATVTIAGSSEYDHPVHVCRRG